MSGEDEEFVVEKIVGKRERKGITEYFIKWKDYPSDDNTWEPISNLNCDSMIEEYEASLKKDKEKEKQKQERKKEESNKRTSKVRSAKYVASDSETDEEWKDDRISTPKSNKKSKTSSNKNKSSTAIADSDSESENQRPVVKRLSGFDRGLEPEKIIGATDIGGELKFLVKWKDAGADTELIPASVANERMPQAVITFYEDRLTWQQTTTADKK